MTDTPTPTMERDSLVARLRDAKLYKCDSCPEEICCHPSADIFVCDDGVFCSECLHEGGRSDDGTPAATLEAPCLTTAAPLQADASAPASPAIGVQAVTLDFHTADTTPDVPRGQMKACIIMMRSRHTGKNFTMPAYYLNAYPLEFEDGCGDEKCEDEHDDGCPVTGWFYDNANFEYENCYYRIEGECLAWALVPDAASVEAALHPAPEAASPEAAAGVEANCPDCNRHIMADPQPATGWLASCGRRLTRLDEFENPSPCRLLAEAASAGAAGEMEAMRLADEIAEARRRLAAWDINSLPNDMPLLDVVDARIDDLRKYMDIIDNLPFRREDIQRGLILFRTSNNAHGLTNFVSLTARVEALPQAAKDELASMMRNIAGGLSPVSPASDTAPSPKGVSDGVRAIGDLVDEMAGLAREFDMLGADRLQRAIDTALAALSQEPVPATAEERAAQEQEAQ